MKNAVGKSVRPPLQDVYEKLLLAYGPQGWWPAETPFEVCVGAILTQQTTWKNVEKALESLRNGGLLSCRALADASPGVVEKHIFPTGFYRQKGRRLKDFCTYLCMNYNCEEGRLLSKPLDGARNELLSLNGIGKETADSMLLYAGAHPIFVVDSYTYRMLSRLWKIGNGVGEMGYDVVQDIFHSSIPSDTDVYREYHALIVEHGKRACHKVLPRCETCVLADVCFFNDKSR